MWPMPPLPFNYKCPLFAWACHGGRGPFHQSTMSPLWAGLCPRPYFQRKVHTATRGPCARLSFQASTYSWVGMPSRQWPSFIHYKQSTVCVGVPCGQRPLSHQLKHVRVKVVRAGPRARHRLRLEVRPMAPTDCHGVGAPWLCTALL